MLSSIPWSLSRTRVKREPPFVDHALHAMSLYLHRHPEYAPGPYDVVIVDAVLFYGETDLKE